MVETVDKKWAAALKATTSPPLLRFHRQRRADERFLARSVGTDVICSGKPALVSALQVHGSAGCSFSGWCRVAAPRLCSSN
jgi:hypothetical protein